MNTNIKTTNVTLSPHISNYVEKRIKKVSKFLKFDDSVQCDMELARTTSHHNKGDVFRAEIHLVGANKNIYASSEKDDLYSAIDEVQNEVMRELSNKKEKRLSLIRRGGSQIKSIVKGLWPWRK